MQQRARASYNVFFARQDAFAHFFSRKKAEWLHSRDGRKRLQSCDSGVDRDYETMSREELLEQGSTLIRIHGKLDLGGKTGLKSWSRFKERDHTDFLKRNLQQP